MHNEISDCDSSKNDRSSSIKKSNNKRETSKFGRLKNELEDCNSTDERKKEFKSPVVLFELKKNLNLMKNESFTEFSSSSASHSLTSGSIASKIQPSK